MKIEELTHARFNGFIDDQKILKRIFKRDYSGKNFRIFGNWKNDSFFRCSQKDADVEKY